MWIELVQALVLLFGGSVSIICFVIGVRIMQCPNHYWNRIRATENIDAKHVLIQRMLNKEYY